MSKIRTVDAIAPFITRYIKGSDWENFASQTKMDISPKALLFFLFHLNRVWSYGFRANATSDLSFTELNADNLSWAWFCSEIILTLLLTLTQIKMIQ